MVDSQILYEMPPGLRAFSSAAVMCNRDISPHILTLPFSKAKKQFGHGRFEVE